VAASNGYEHGYMANQGVSVGKRRDYRSGSIYQTADGYWRGAITKGYTASGGRKRYTVTGKTKAEATRRLRDKARELESAGAAAASSRTTVKAWADEWLPIAERTQRPHTMTATRSAVSGWIVPAIGHRRLNELAPPDVRAVTDAIRRAGLSSSTQRRTHSVLMTLLKAAQAEGHVIAANVLAVKAPVAAVSDRTSMQPEEAVAVLAVAATIPQGSRWVAALLNGVRQGEALGLTWDSVDFERNELVLAWQVQPLPYRIRFDRSSGFRVPDGYEARQLYGRLHLVRPKSRRGYRVLPMVPWMRSALEAWREECPESPHGLVWPLLDGRPTPAKVDDEEWYALQDAADVRHPSGRFYTNHETRHTTATLLALAGVDRSVIETILGQSKLVDSYLHIRRSPQVADALGKVAERLAIE
jgi:integrase